MTKQMSFSGAFFLIKRPFFDQKMSFWRFDRKRGEMMEKMRKKKKRFLLFRISLFAGSDFWKRGARAKQDLGTAVITHSLSSLRIGTNFSKRRLNKATKSMSLPLPWTKAKH